MPEHAPSPDGRLRNPEVRREPTDVSLKGTLITISVSIAAMIVILIGIDLMFNGWQSQLNRDRQPQFSLTPGPTAGPPPEPRLEQIDRVRGIDPNVARMGEQLQQLQHYGRSEETGYVEVPIDRAIEHLQGKLPARQEPSAKESRRSGGLIDAGEPNSGRLFKKGEH
jgi:hypothetical protein